MKRVISFVLCLLMMCTLLVSCGDNEIGSYIENYPETDNTVKDMTLNMYLIVGEGTTQNAKETVQNIVKQYTYSKFKTNLVLHYVSEENYKSTVTEAVKGDDTNGAHIVLINSFELMKELFDGGYLANLTSYFDTRDYGRLNSEITASLLEASKITKKTNDSVTKSLYSIPNDHVVGTYEYLVINKAVARDMLHYSNELLASFKTDEDIAELISDIEKLGYDPSEIVYRTSGPYELKQTIEGQGNFCNVTAYPTVDEYTAFSSAFAIVNRHEDYVERAMEIIYELHNPDDHYLRNLIQYGVELTNYTLDESGKVVSFTEGENVYNMNPLYTGNIFYALYSDKIGWNETVKNNGKIQNDESVVNLLGKFTESEDTPAQ